MKDDELSVAKRDIVDMAKHLVDAVDLIVASLDDDNAEYLVSNLRHQLESTCKRVSTLVELELELRHRVYDEGS